MNFRDFSWVCYEFDVIVRGIDLLLFLFLSLGKYSISCGKYSIPGWGRVEKGWKDWGPGGPSLHLRSGHQLSTTTCYHSIFTNTQLYWMIVNRGLGAGSSHLKKQEKSILLIASYLKAVITDEYFLPRSDSFIGSLKELPFIWCWWQIVLMPILFSCACCQPNCNIIHLR